MTKDVLVSIAGLQFEAQEEEAIEMISAGDYYFRNGKHYVLYDELQTDSPEYASTVKCIIKMNNQQIEVIKKGPSAAHMIFELGQTHMTLYSTPYGDLMMGITTKSLTLTESEDLIKVNLTYALDVNYQFASDCTLSIEVKPRGRG